MERVLSFIITSGTVGGVVGFLLAYLIQNFLGGTRWKKGIKILLFIVEDILEDTDIDLPSFLDEMLERLNQLNEDTEDIEELVREEKESIK